MKRSIYFTFILFRVTFADGVSCATVSMSVDGFMAAKGAIPTELAPPPNKFRERPCIWRLYNAKKTF